MRANLRIHFSYVQFVYLYMYVFVIATTVMKSGRIRPHSKQLMLGKVRLG